jgi:hypothetical protein
MVTATFTPQPVAITRIPTLIATGTPTPFLTWVQSFLRERIPPQRHA